MIYEIINPSDMYTMETEDLEAACIATLALGSGWYSLKDENGEDVMPILAFGGDDKFFAEKFGKSMEQSIDDLSHERLAAVLETVMIGDKQQRKMYHEAMALIDDPEKKKAWRDKWHDEHRSSLNDIGGRAWKIAERLRQKAE